MNSAIRTYELAKKFYKVTAVDGLNLDVPEAAIYALVGPNGAGKTTAIKVPRPLLNQEGESLNSTSTMRAIAWGLMSFAGDWRTFSAGGRI